MADRLADQVEVQWSAEAKRRNLNWPPLPVSWQPADPSLAEPWARLQQRAAAGAGWTPPAHPTEYSGSRTGWLKLPWATPDIAGQQVRKRLTGGA